MKPASLDRTVNTNALMKAHHTPPSIETARQWERLYQTKGPTEVSWYRPHLEVSLQLITSTGINPDASIIDVGAGLATLIDDLLAKGYRNLTALDISETALNAIKSRLGANATLINWFCGDVRTYPLPFHYYDLWHDRAVFHFLVDSADRTVYVDQVRRAVKPGGHVIVATFGPEGPTSCSGLPVTRYSAEALHAAFGTDFHLIEHLTEFHQTPGGSIQQFTYCLFRLSNSPAGG